MSHPTPPAAQVPSTAAPPMEAHPEGHLEEREVIALKQACLGKHKEKGKAGISLIRIVALVASIATYLFTGSLLLAFAIFFVGGNSSLELYHSLRNRDYLDARNALSEEAFQTYIREHRLNLSIDTIISIHKAHTQALFAQTRALT